MHVHASAILTIAKFYQLDLQCTPIYNYDLQAHMNHDAARRSVYSKNLTTLPKFDELNMRARVDAQLMITRKNVSTSSYTYVGNHTVLLDTREIA